jgi:hypothetical protein
MISKLSGVLVVGAFVVAGATGCTRAKAKTTPDVPTLDMPAPPPRDIEVNESEPPPPMPLPQEPTRNTPARPRPQPAAPAPAPRPNEPTRTEPPKIEPPPAEPPHITEEPPRPAPTLQTTPAQADVEVERTIRATMTKAANDLNRIDYRALNADARTQYDTAKGFIAQADTALNRKNLEFARTLADKAAALAAQLRGR